MLLGSLIFLKQPNTRKKLIYHQIFQNDSHKILHWLAKNILENNLEIHIVMSLKDSEFTLEFSLKETLHSVRKQY